MSPFRIKWILKIKGAMKKKIKVFGNKTRRRIIVPKKDENGEGSTMGNLKVYIGHLI